MTDIINIKYKKPELVVPAGDFEKLRTAVEYGADAVYAGGEGFNLRMRATNMTLQEIKDATDWVHGRNKKIYIALNIFARNYHIDGLRPYLERLGRIPDKDVSHQYDNYAQICLMQYKF